MCTSIGACVLVFKTVPRVAFLSEYLMYIVNHDCVLCIYIRVCVCVCVAGHISGLWICSYAVRTYIHVSQLCAVNSIVPTAKHYITICFHPMNPPIYPSLHYEAVDQTVVLVPDVNV